MKRNIIYINNYPYKITLPSGGDTAQTTQHSDWDNALKTHAYIKNDHNGEIVGSWCSNIAKEDSNKRAVRGLMTTKSWDSLSANARSLHVGFRPMLFPLGPNSLGYEPSLLSYMSGKKIQMGTLIVNGKIMIRPFEYIYRKGDRVEIGDSVGDKSKLIEWAVSDFRLIALNNLMIDVSWNQLLELGFISGYDMPSEAVDVNTAIFRGITMGNGYLLMSVGSQKNSDLTQMVVKESFIENYIKFSPYANLVDFFQTYHPETSQHIEGLAKEAEAWAFSYKPYMEKKLDITENTTSNVLGMLMKFMNKYLEFK